MCGASCPSPCHLLRDSSYGHQAVEILYISTVCALCEWGTEADQTREEYVQGDQVPEVCPEEL